jgi:hypothetical protein
MAVSWPSGVNTNAYGMDIGGGDNVTSVEFESGKARTYLKNSAPKRVFSFIIEMEDVGAASEYKVFLSWWNNTLLSGALSFYFPDLITHTGLKEYRMTDTYSAVGQKHKEVKLSAEEM